MNTEYLLQLQLCRTGTQSLKLPDVGTGSAIFRLVAPAGGVRLPGDDRLLNLRVFQIRWGAVYGVLDFALT
jgi:hypothetical protein